jgi:sortase (surface protein transpeptidase)
MYPGADLHPKYWHEPLRAGTDVRLETGLPDGFEAASADDYRRFAEPKTAAMKLSIPSLGIESAVTELSILDLGDSREYETPDNIIGHIPETADPGELGNGWFFGHLESPLRGEGSVFRRLPEIPMLLRHFAEIGEGAVYVLLESATGIYLYEVVATNVMHASDLRLYDTDGVYITLVTCVPRLDYSHRLLVTAKLVGVST